MSEFVILIVERVDGAVTPFTGKYVKAYDPKRHKPNGGYDGGFLEVTENIDEALAFENPGDAMEKWRQPAGCACHGIRWWDNKPNRPLTAYTVTIQRRDREDASARLMGEP